MRLFKFNEFIKEGVVIDEDEEVKLRRIKKAEKREKYVVKLTAKNIDKSDIQKYNIPEKIEKMMLEWPVIRKSPYSDSFYNSEDITWNYKPDGSYRVSDHWNFNAVNKKTGELVRHCVTDQKVPNNTHISIGKYDRKSGKYSIILSEPTTKHIDNLSKKEKKLKYLQSPEVIWVKKLFKQSVLDKKVLIDITYKSKQIKGVLRKWTGNSLSIENDSGEVIFTKNTIDKKDIKSITLMDRSGNIVDNPY